MNFSQHPIHSRNYMINTHPAQRFVYSLQTWMARGSLGGFAHGYPRAGKTEMSVDACCRLVTRAGEPIAAFHIPQKTVTISTDKKFWSFMLASLQIQHHPRRDAGELYPSLLGFLREAAATNGENRVVLFIDEAQKLSRFNYELLLDLMNDLVKVRVNPMFVSVGSEELPDLVEAYHPIKDANLRGRFFNGKHRIYGLRGDDEIRHALTWYDQAHPEQHVSTPFTQDFLPLAYSTGFRLADHATQMWAVFQRMTGRSYKQVGWGMQYFHSTVRMLLVDLLTDGAPLSDEAVEVAIQNSGLFGPVEES